MTGRRLSAGLLGVLAVITPVIQACNDDFNDCTQECASCRQPADCPIPTLRKRAGGH
jgi:hypothetical protein